MFVTKKAYRSLKERVKYLEQLVDQNEKYLSDRLNRLEKKVGTPKRSPFDFSHYLFGLPPYDPSKNELSLYEQVTQMKDLLGIKTSITQASTRLVMTPKETKTKKGKKS